MIFVWGFIVVVLIVLFRCATTSRVSIFFNLGPEIIFTVALSGDVGVTNGVDIARGVLVATPLTEDLRVSRVESASR